MDTIKESGSLSKKSLMLRQKRIGIVGSTITTMFRFLVQLSAGATPGKMVMIPKTAKEKCGVPLPGMNCPESCNQAQNSKQP